MKLELELTQEMYGSLKTGNSLEQETIDTIASCDFYTLDEVELERSIKCPNAMSCNNAGHYHFEEFENRKQKEHPGYKELEILLPNDFYWWLQAECNSMKLGDNYNSATTMVEYYIVNHLIECFRSESHRNKSTYKTVEEIQNGSKKKFEKFYDNGPIDRATECNFENCHTGRCKAKDSIKVVNINDTVQDKDCTKVVSTPRSTNEPDYVYHGT